MHFPNIKYEIINTQKYILFVAEPIIDALLKLNKCSQTNETNDQTTNFLEEQRK